MKFKKIITSVFLSTFLVGTSTAFANTTISSDMQEMIDLLESQGYTVDYSNIEVTVYDGTIDEPTATIITNEPTTPVTTPIVQEENNTITLQGNRTGEVIQYDGQGYWIREVVGENYILEEIFGTGAKIQVPVSTIDNFMDAQDKYIKDNDIYIKENGYAEGGVWNGVQRRFIYERPVINRQIEPLTEAPVVGTVLGNILNDGVDTTKDKFSTSDYTRAYRQGASQCASYVMGRWKEVYGITDISMSSFELSSIAGGTHEWVESAKEIDSLVAIENLYDIRPQTIAVFSNGVEGHVEFIEYIEYDSSGNLKYVYYTDANGLTTLVYDQYKHGYDGQVQKETFENYISKNKSKKLIGYIAPNIQ